MLLTGQVGVIRDKLLRRVAASAAAVGAAPAAEPDGPPLFVAGHINAHGGYDHLVCQAAAGLTAAGVRLHRDPRAFMDPKWGPNGRVPAKRKYAFDQPRLAVIPPHLLYRFWPGRHTAAWTMWETDTLPRGSAEYLNRCGLLLIPSRWGVECFRANGVTTPAEVVRSGTTRRCSARARPTPGRRCVRSAPPGARRGRAAEERSAGHRPVREAFPIAPTCD
jgi:hypothetical protein